MRPMLTAADLDGFISGNDLLFRKVFQYSNDAILIIDPDPDPDPDPDHDLIIDANPAACAKLGYVYAALLQLPLNALFGQHWSRWQGFVEAVLNEGHGTLEDIDCVTQKNTPLPVEISASGLLLGEHRCFVVLLHDLSRHRAEEQLFHTIAQGIAALTGDEFFRALVKVLAQTLAVDYAFVSEFTHVKNRVRALAYWTPAGYGETFEYDLDGTPCEAVLKGEIRHYEEDVRHLFRRDRWLTDIGAESFLAIPLMDTQGNVLGHLAAIHTRPMAMVPRDLSLFRIFAGRATVEVLRQQAERRRQLAEDALRASETRLSTILASAMDAVITFDDEHHIVLFNTAAEKIFRCSAEWARGQPFDRFLSKRFRSLLENYLQQLASASGPDTGATTERKGRFELADGGSLFLDEVGELSATAQAKLLRVLQEQEFERVGGSKPIKVDARVIAATNRDLAAMVKHGAFRADLYYRLNVFPIRIPPLRERHEDIPVLARHFLRQLARKLGKPLADIAPRSLTKLQVYPWPGNVRELQNVIERAAVLASGPLIDIDDALEMRLELPAGCEAQAAGFSGTLEEVEHSYISQVLEGTRWTIEGDQGVAAILALHPSTLRSRMHKLGIKRPPLR